MQGPLRTPSPFLWVSTLARRGVVPRVAGQRMQAFWSDVIPETRFITQGAGSTIGSVAVGGTATTRVTIARLRGSCFAHLDSGAITEGALVGIGLILVKEEAFTVGGVASMPSPLSDANQSWLWHQVIVLGPSVSATDDGGDMSRNARILIDSKAQRKMQAGDTLAFVSEVEITAGSPTVDLQAAVRFMALLP